MNACSRVLECANAGNVPVWTVCCLQKLDQSVCCLDVHLWAPTAVGQASGARWLTLRLSHRQAHVPPSAAHAPLDSLSLLQLSPLPVMHDCRLTNSTSTFSAVNNEKRRHDVRCTQKETSERKCSLGITCVVVCLPRPPNVRACHHSVVGDLISGRTMTL